MPKALFVCISSLPFILTGCTSMSEIVPAGKDTYMVTASDLSMGASGSTLKAMLYKKASEYCEKQNKELLPVNDASVDYRVFRGTANSELTFRCLHADDPELKRPELKS